MKFFLLLLIIFITTCTTGFKTKKILVKDQKTAIYTIKKEEVPKTKLLDGQIIHPYKISYKTLTDIIGNLKFTKTTRINNFTDYLFHQEQLNESLENLSTAFENIDDTQILVVIVMHDQLKSVLSNYKRTSFYSWVDEFGLNIVFSEIQEDVSKDKSLNFYDWTQIEPIDLEYKPDENKILKDESFTFKKIKGFSNKKWLIFSLNDLTKYKFQNRESDNLIKE